MIAYTYINIRFAIEKFLSNSQVQISPKIADKTSAKQIRRAKHNGNSVPRAKHNRMNQQRNDEDEREREGETKIKRTGT